MQTEIECKIEMIENFNKLLCDVVKGYHTNDYNPKIIDMLVVSIKSFYDNNTSPKTSETSEESLDFSDTEIPEPVKEPVIEKPKVDKLVASFLNNSMNIDSYYYLNSINNMRINNYCSQITNY